MYKPALDKDFATVRVSQDIQLRNALEPQSNPIKSKEKILALDKYSSVKTEKRMLEKAKPLIVPGLSGHDLFKKEPIDLEKISDYQTIEGDQDDMTTLSNQPQKQELPKSLNDVDNNDISQITNYYYTKYKQKKRR